MKGDYTRFTFRRVKHYNSVRLQQGRVQLDADWNEQGDIQAHLQRTEAIDVIGSCGVPRENGGFEINFDESKNDITISRGRIYVDGILCENEEDTDSCETISAGYGSPDIVEAGNPELFSKQPHLKGKALPEEPGLYVFYLDVWQRHITALEDPSIREVALGGPDTATRTQVVWQVKWLLLGEYYIQEADITCEGINWPELFAQNKGCLGARAVQEEDTERACIVAASAGYTGLENQLYRVEIHDSGEAGAATFKWSRDNGIVVSRLESVDIINKNLTVSDVGKDEVLAFRPNHWVEITDEHLLLHGEPGILVKLTKVKGNVLEYEWPEDVQSQPDDLKKLEEVLNALDRRSKNATVRRWDHGDGTFLLSKDGASAAKKAPLEKGAVLVPTEPDTWIELENGVQIYFDGMGRYSTADYWLIPARTVGGSVEWPLDDKNFPELQLPHGIEHHYCPLALATVNALDDGSPPLPRLEVIRDCRRLFSSLTELGKPILYYIGGDGQEAMPEETLPQPLRVGVANGLLTTEEGMWVKFEVVAGDGTLEPDTSLFGYQLLQGSPTAVKAFITPAIFDGINQWAVWSDWRLPALQTDGEPPEQLVKATLLKAPVDRSENEVGVPVFFGAGFSVAWKVRYGGSDFPDMQHPDLRIDTAEAALDQLRENTGLFYVSGDGQEAKPDERLARPLQVRVSNGQWPRKGATVTFVVGPNSGTLESADGSKGSELDILTDVDGVAECYWWPDPQGPHSQQVTATLNDPLVGNTAGSPPESPGLVRFNTNLSVADEVTYEPRDTSPPDKTTVQDALDDLFESKADREEIEPLIDGSIADGLHRHSQLFPSDSAPGSDAVVNVDTNSNVGVGTTDSPNRLQLAEGDLAIGDKEHRRGKIRLWQEETNNDDEHVSHGIGTELFHNTYGAGSYYQNSIGHKFYSGGYDLIAQVGFGGEGQPDNRLDSYFAGNVGIGTENPETDLEIQKGDDAPDGPILSITHRATGESRATIRFGLGESGSPSEVQPAAEIAATNPGTDPGDLELAFRLLSSDRLKNYVRLLAELEDKEIPPTIIAFDKVHPGWFYIIGDLLVSGVKGLAIDHPLKPGFTLVHAALEGPEAAVFYRGEGRLNDDKRATIKLPDYFEKLTRKEGRTVQLTAKGSRPFTLSATDVENGRFTVNGTLKEGEFFWEVKAIRVDIKPLVVERKLHR